MSDPKVDIPRQDELGEVPARLPLLPLRDVVIFPGAVVPLLVGRERSIMALSAATEAEKLLVVSAQREPDVADPGPEDLYALGTLVRIHQMLRLPDGTTKILIEGLSRAEVLNYHDDDGYWSVEFELHEPPSEATSTELEALCRQVLELFQQYAELHRRIPEDTLAAVQRIEDPGHLADSVAAQLAVQVSTRQELLAKVPILHRLREIATVLQREIEILSVERRIEGEVKQQVEKGQKEYYLNEQLRAIRKELGYGPDEDDEIEELIARIEDSGMSDEAREVALKEVGRLAKMAPMSPESTVIRNYLDTLLGLPWQERTKDHLDTKRVRKRLDNDHFGLDKVKERILEFLSVVKLTGRLQGSILCLVGPPGVGKTSLGRSIADSMGRSFVRVSLGGVRDDAEIRGHRRTYIGSRPGRIIDGLRRAGTRNPVFLLDEIDKLGSDFRGDPSSALLEVLDPEQNSSYSDHFLEVPFDLSEVLFITTANVIHQIPAALEDRMEIIRIPGYLEHEKVAIAKNFLLPKLRKTHGLQRTRFTVSDAALHDAVNLYTREAGVRNLERQLASLCRKVARRKAERSKVPRVIQRTNLHRFLGSPKYLHRMVEEEPEVGVVTGLAWTPVGGEILEIEVAALPGKGRLTLTGNLKEVMRESARAALSYTRSIVPDSKEFLEKHDIHIHVPEGAVPKDGPSAGVAMATALVSMMTGRRVRRDIAMTGELTLRGKILPIGGLPEKAVAAQRFGCKHIVVPAENEKDYRELPRDVRRGLQWHLVSRAQEVFDLALLPAEKEAEAKSPDRSAMDTPPEARPH